MQIETVDLIVISLAVSWLARTLAYEAIADGLRERLGVKYDANGRAYSSKFFGRMSLCPICSSLWIAIPVCTLYIVTPTLTLIGCLPLAVASLSMARSLDG